MIDRLEVQMQAMQMLARVQEVTADNLANLNTPGFRGSRVFQRMMVDRLDNGTMKTEWKQQVNIQGGELEMTGNELDFGIDGNGFFVVEENGQTLLTRDGRFRLDPDGYLVNHRGAQVQGDSGPIHIPGFFFATGRLMGDVDFEVASDGTIRLNNEVFDRFRIEYAEAPGSLERRGGSYFFTDRYADPSEEHQSRVMQGYFEHSTVDPLREMVSMMKTMRMFEAQQRAMRSTDETISQMAGTLARF